MAGDQDKDSSSSANSVWSRAYSGFLPSKDEEAVIAPSAMEPDSIPRASMQRACVVSSTLLVVVTIVVVPGAASVVVVSGSGSQVQHRSSLKLCKTNPASHVKVHDFSQTTSPD